MAIELFAQQPEVSIPPAPDGMAVVYFVRTSSLGLAINFSYFDSTKLIGRFNGPKYIRYECTPGHHLLWGRSENRDYIEAEVEAGKIYFIWAVPEMGFAKASIGLYPVDPSDEKTMTKIFKLMAKQPAETFTSEKLEADAKDLKEAIDRGMEKYKEIKEKGLTVQKLSQPYN